MKCPNCGETSRIREKDKFCHKCGHSLQAGMREMEQRVCYLCDGKKECCRKTGCYQNGGKCKHTKDIEHAKNFYKKGTLEQSSFWEEEEFGKENEEKQMKKRLEKTTIKICEHIEECIDNGGMLAGNEIAEEIKALAALIQASAYVEHVNA